MASEQVADALNVPLPITAVQRERYWQKIREAESARRLFPLSAELLQSRRCRRFGHAHRAGSLGGRPNPSPGGHRGHCPQNRVGIAPSGAPISRRYCFVQYRRW
jgi:hypothetical protein